MCISSDFPYACFWILELVTNVLQCDSDLISVIFKNEMVISL